MLNNKEAINNIQYAEAPKRDNSPQMGMIAASAIIRQVIDFLRKELPGMTLNVESKDAYGLSKDIVILNKNIESMEDTYKKADTSVAKSIPKLMELTDSLASAVSSMEDAAKCMADSAAIYEAPVFNVPDKVTVSNFKELIDALKSLEKKIELNEPLERVEVTNLAELKLPKDISDAIKNLEKLSDKAKSPISVRLSDGERFIKELAKGNSEIVKVLGGNFTANKDNEGTLVVTSKVGANCTNTFATVGVSSAVAVAANTSRVSLTLVNDSSNTIYLSKGATAVSGSGIRLNASGGSLIIDDFKGAIHAIAGGAGSNLTVCEVTV